MKYKIYDEKTFARLLKSNGYSLNRCNGSHQIWTKAGRSSISVPKSINPMIARRLIKENSLGD